VQTEVIELGPADGQRAHRWMSSRNLKSSNMPSSSEPLRFIRGPPEPTTRVSAFRRPVLGDSVADAGESLQCRFGPPDQISAEGSSSRHRENWRGLPQVQKSANFRGEFVSDATAGVKLFERYRDWPGFRLLRRSPGEPSASDHGPAIEYCGPLGHQPRVPVPRESSSSRSTQAVVQQVFFFFWACSKAPGSVLERRPAAAADPTLQLRVRARCCESRQLDRRFLGELGTRRASPVGRGESHGAFRPQHRRYIPEFFFLCSPRYDPPDRSVFDESHRTGLFGQHLTLVDDVGRDRNLPQLSPQRLW